MTDNVTIRDYSGSPIVMRTIDTGGGIHIPRQYIEPAAQAVVSGPITAVAQTVFIDTERVNNLTVFMVASGLSGHTATFEASVNSTNGSDGDWFTVNAVRTNGNSVEAGPSPALSATPAYAWKVSTNGYTWFRVRCTAITAGTATWYLSPSPFATDPVPASQTPTGAATVILSHSSTVGPANAKNIKSAATTNSNLIKSTAGILTTLDMSNNHAANTCYVKLYNKATAPVVGTDTPLYVFSLRPNESRNINCGGAGIRFSAGIGVGISGGIADADTTAITANDVVVNMTWA